MEPIWRDFAQRPMAAQRLRLDVDEVDSPLYKRWGYLWEQRREMPQVCWLDRYGRLLERRPGLTSLQLLQQRTNYWLRSHSARSRVP